MKNENLWQGIGRNFELWAFNFQSRVMLSVLLIFISPLFFHPLHVSVTEIKFDAKDKELEITSRIFIDDLEEAIRKQLAKPTLDILNPGAGTTTDGLVSTYLANCFSIKIDGKAVKINYLAHEIEGDAMVVYFFAPNVKKVKTIEVHHSAITEVYEDQSNLIHVTVGGKTRSMRLMRATPSDQLVFEK